ncbi:MAG: cupin domain-containing protein [Thermodesulfobacteriota bacterium]
MIKTNIKKVDKPWGYELWWAHTDKYVGKILHINKGESLSYQYHEVKDESLYLYSGKMTMDIEEEGGVRETVTLSAGSSVRIRPFTKHRMTAIEECDVLEVSTPEIDDIVRIEDRYGRV